MSHQTNHLSRSGSMTIFYSSKEDISRILTMWAIITFVALLLCTVGM